MTTPWRRTRAVKLLLRLANGEGVPPELRYDDDPLPNVAGDSAKWKRALLLARLAFPHLLEPLQAARMRGSALTWERGRLRIVDGVVGMPPLELERAAHDLLTDLAAVERMLNERQNQRSARYWRKVAA